MTLIKENIKYFCDINSIEQNALQQIVQYSKNEHIDKVCAFTDIHYCDEIPWSHHMHHHQIKLKKTNDHTERFEFDAYCV